MSAMSVFGHVMDEHGTGDSGDFFSKSPTIQTKSPYALARARFRGTVPRRTVAYSPISAVRIAVAGDRATKKMGACWLRARPMITRGYLGSHKSWEETPGHFPSGRYRVNRLAADQAASTLGSLLFGIADLPKCCASLLQAIMLIY